MFFYNLNGNALKGKLTVSDINNILPLMKVNNIPSGFIYVVRRYSEVDNRTPIISLLFTGYNERIEFSFLEKDYTIVAEYNYPLFVKGNTSFIKADLRNKLQEVFPSVVQDSKFTSRRVEDFRVGDLVSFPPQHNLRIHSFEDSYVVLFSEKLNEIVDRIEYRFLLKYWKITKYVSSKE